MSDKEKEVFEQKLSKEELNMVSGGSDSGERDPCVKQDLRNIRAGKGFPNCAATVESGSWCMSTDACLMNAVVYYDMKDCSKAWE